MDSLIRPKGYLGTIEAGEKYQHFIQYEAANALHLIRIDRINRREVTRVGADVPSQWAGELIMVQIGRTVEESDALNTIKPVSYNHGASLERTKEFNHSDPRNPEAEYPHGVRLVFDHTHVMPDKHPPCPPDSAA